MKQLSQHLYLSWNNTNLGQKGPGSNPGQATNPSFHKNETKINPLSPNSDYHQFSPNNIHMLPREMVMRIKKMITKEKML